MSETEDENLEHWIAMDDGGFARRKKGLWPPRVLASVIDENLWRSEFLVASYRGSVVPTAASSSVSKPALANRQALPSNVFPGTLYYIVKASPTMTVGLSFLPKDTQGRRHKHSVDEIYVLYSGRAFVYKNDTCSLLSAGMATFIPSNVPHALKTLEDTILIWRFPVPMDAVEYDFLSA